MSEPAFAAVFDWDGVIINSEECHRAGWERLALELSRELPEGYFENSFGRRNVEIIPELLGWSHEVDEIARLARRKEEHYRDIVRERQVEALPGVVPWLEVLLAAGIPCGIGSSTARANIDLSLELIGCKRFFRTVVSAEDVTLGKPDPSIFLLVASRLGVESGKCVVFEDALFGIEAAKRAGMKCVGVATTFPAEQLTKDTNRVVHRLDELTVGELSSWF